MEGSWRVTHLEHTKNWLNSVYLLYSCLRWLAQVAAAKTLKCSSCLLWNSTTLLRCRLIFIAIFWVVRRHVPRNRCERPEWRLTTQKTAAVEKFSSGGNCTKTDFFAEKKKEVKSLCTFMVTHKNITNLVRTKSQVLGVCRYVWPVLGRSSGCVGSVYSYEGRQNGS